MSWPGPGRYICNVHRGQRKVSRIRVTPFAGRRYEWKIRERLGRAVLFLHHHFVTSATAAGRCFCLFKAVSDVVSAMSAMSAGARSVELALVWEHFAPGETGEMVVKTIRSEPTGWSVNKGTGRGQAGRLCRQMSSKPVLVGEWEQWTDRDDLRDGLVSLRDAVQMRGLWSWFAVGRWFGQGGFRWSRITGCVCEWVWGG